MDNGDMYIRIPENRAIDILLLMCNSIDILILIQIALSS